MLNIIIMLNKNRNNNLIKPDICYYNYNKYSYTKKIYPFNNLLNSNIVDSIILKDNGNVTNRHFITKIYEIFVSSIKQTFNYINKYYFNNYYDESDDKSDDESDDDSEYDDEFDDEYELFNHIHKIFID